MRKGVGGILRLVSDGKSTRSEEENEERERRHLDRMAVQTIKEKRLK